MMRSLALGALLLERRIRPLSRIALRQGLRGDFFHRLQRLSRRNAGRRPTLDGHSPEIVVANERWRSDDDANLRKAAKGNHVPVLVPHIDPENVVDP